MLPRLERQHDVLEVVAMRRRHVDDVHIVIRHELGIRAVGLHIGDIGALDVVLEERGRATSAARRGDGRDGVPDVRDVSYGWIGEQVFTEDFGGVSAGTVSFSYPDG
jgi:hypothetical protein